MTLFKWGFIGLMPDELQVKHSRWSREAHYGRAIAREVLPLVV